MKAAAHIGPDSRVNFESMKKSSEFLDIQEKVSVITVLQPHAPDDMMLFDPVTVPTSYKY